MFKRISLFLLVNIAVVLTISILLSIFNIQPFLQSYGINYQSLLAFCLIWGMGGAFISLMLSRITAKWMTGAQVISPKTTDPALMQIYSTVERLARAANLPCTPEVAIFYSEAPNAFATGPTKKRSLVALSSGLMSKLSKNEVEAVIGHEIAHIANGDMVTMTLLQGIINAFVMFLARILAFVVSRSGKSEKGSSGSFSMGSYYLFVFLFEIVFMILGSMIVAFYSRRREFKADKGGATLSSTQNMINALNALERSSVSVKNQKPAEALEAFMIHSQKRSLLSKLFASHPPISERIEKLEKDRYSN
jgi:heat shock protein HtpX